MKKELIVIGREEIVSEGLHRINTSPLFNNVIAKRISVQKIKQSLNDKIDLIGEMLSDAEDKVEKFKLEEVEFSLELSAQGEVAILGSGISTGMSSGIKLKFIRK